MDVPQWVAWGFDNWNGHYNDITSVIFDASFRNCTSITSTAYWFYECRNIESISGLNNLNTSNVTNMQCMFECPKVTSLDVSGFNTANVTSMGSMFSGCSALTSLDVRGFNTANVTSMGNMFSGCSALTSLDVSGFNTANVTSMGGMFSGCSGLTSLDVSGFNTSNVTDMSWMFSGCSSLTSLDLKGFNTSNVTDMSNIFDGCSGLINLDLSSFNTSKVTDMIDMFRNCSGLTNLDLSSFNTSNVTNMYEMFTRCSDLTGIYVSSGWSNASVINGDLTFYECFNLRGGNGTAYDGIHVDYDYAHIDGGPDNPGYFSEKKVEPYAYLSDDRTTLTFCYDSNRGVRNGYAIRPFTYQGESGWYGESSNITTVVFDESFATCDTIRSTAWWFHSCNLLSEIRGLEYLKTDSVTDMSHMFEGCGSIISLDLSGLNTDLVTDMSMMFGGMLSLKSIDLSSFNTSQVVTMEGMFNGCSVLDSLSVLNFNTANVTNMSYMFSGLSAVTSLDLSSFNTAKVTTMRDMFRNSSNLKTIYVSDSWQTSATIDGYDMFFNCDSIVGGSGTTYNRSNVGIAYAIIDGGASNPGYLTYKGLQPYAVLSEASTVLTFYYDDKREERNGMSVYPFEYAFWRGWNDSDSLITTVVFDSSFVNCLTLESTAYWFHGCDNLESIIGIENLRTPNVTSMRYMFSGCSSLESIDLSRLETENVTLMEAMFSNCTSLTSLDLSNFKTGNVTEMTGLFYGCSGLTSLDLSNFDTSSVTIMRGMFYICNGLQTVDLTNFNTSNVMNMTAMFEGCSSLTSLDLSSFNTVNVEYIDRMFISCSNLAEIKVSNLWTAESVVYGENMFIGCISLVGGMGTTFDSNHTDYTYAHIDGGPDNPGYFSAKAMFDGLTARISSDAPLDDAFVTVGGRSEAAKTISAIVWNNSTALTAEMLEGIDNPNLLIFVSDASLAPENSRNVVVDGYLARLTLTDTNSGNNNFYCPQAFTVGEISYTHNFSQQTEIDVSRGWETIALPFTVETITHETHGAISPFGNTGSDYHFWLQQLTDNGLERATAIEANRPYLISMPNNETYPADYNQAGRVTFAARNVTVPVSSLQAQSLTDNSLALVPTFQQVKQASSVYALNIGEARGQYAEGSVFESGYRAVRPFEAYTLHGGSNARYIPVNTIGADDHATGIDVIRDGSSVESDIWHTLDGRRLDTEPTRKGVYIRNGQKVVVR